MRALRLYLCAAMALVLVLCQAPAGLARADAPTPQDGIAYWCRLYDVSCSLMTQMAEIESSMRPDAYNPSGASGLYQFEPATWTWMRAAENDDTSYAPGLAAQRLYDPEGGTPWNAWSAAHLTAWALAHGYGCQWVSFQMITGSC